MAVNSTVLEQHRSADNAINNIIEVISKDKRSDKKWTEKVFQSVEIIKKTLSAFKDEILRLNSEDNASTTKTVNLYSHAVQPKVSNSKSVVLVAPKNPETIQDSEQTLQIVRSSTYTRR